MHRTIEVTLPPAATEAFIASIETNDNVIGVTLQRGGSVKPSGDVVTILTLNRGADEVMRAVARARLTGTVSVATAELASLSDADRQAAIDDDIDEALWEELETGLRHQGRVSVNFLLLMALGGAIAAAGVLAEPAVATIAYVASAVIAPGFEPIAKIGLGLVLKRGEVIKAGIISTLAGYAVLIAAAAMTWWLLDATGSVSESEFLRSDGLKHTLDPDGARILIAVCGAFAGVVISAAYRRSVIAGALIALPIIEVAGVVGIALAMGHFEIVDDSLQRLAFDVGLIVGASLIVLGLKQILVHQRAPLH